MSKILSGYNLSRAGCGKVAGRGEKVVEENGSSAGNEEKYAVYRIRTII